MKTTMELKPYSEYKESGVPWLGKVPGHWSSRPGMAVLKEKQVKNTGLKEKTVLTLSYGKIKIKPQDKLHGLVPETFETYQIVEPSDIIIRPTDLQNDKVSLRVGKVKNKGIITSAYICMKPVNGLQPDYAHLLLHSLDLMKVFYSLGSGLRQNLSWIDFKRLPCYIPTKEEQSQIARFLNYKSSQIARFIHAKKRLLELLKEQKQAIINDAVTGKIDVSTGKPYPKYKESGVEWLGKVPEGWEVRPLYSSYNAQLGKMLDEKRITGAFLKPYLRNTDVQWHTINVRNLPQMDFAPHELSRFTIKKGDILVCEGGVPGRAAVWDGDIEDCCYQKALHRLRPRIPKEYPEYFCFVLQAAVFLNAFSREEKATILHLPNDQFRSHRFPSPSRNEQEGIVLFVKIKIDKMNLLISRTEREISLIEEYRTRLIADVVTGKIDVRGIDIPSDYYVVQSDTAEEEPEDDSPDIASEEGE